MARVVKDADTLDVDLEIAEFGASGFHLAKDWEAMRAEISKKLFTHSAKMMWEQILHANPHDWHLRAKHRFSTGKQ